jgi:hypothetical protein
VSALRKPLMRLGRIYEQLNGKSSLDVFRMSEEGCVIVSSPSLNPMKIAAAPTGIPRFKLVSYQNAAGMWLKYGA